MKQNILLFFLCCFCFCNRVDAQSDFRIMTSIESLKNRMKEESDTLTNIESRFTQTKRLRLLSEKIVSTGVFSYQKPDKVSLDYLSPMKYRMVINGNTIKIDADGKTNTFDTGSNRLMAQMSALISACMTGNLERLTSDYELTYKENDTRYWIAISPQGSAKTYMKCIDIFLDKKDFSVRQLKITEPSDDYTEYVFNGQKKNITFPNAKFAVK